MSAPNIVVIGASTGGIAAIGDVLRTIPGDCPAAFFVVQHIGSHSVNYLPEILQKTTTLPVRHAEDETAIRESTVHVAPSDYHLLIDRDQMFLSHGPRENRTRPAIDPLFRSAALSHGPRVIGVVLTGALDDGTAGMVEIKRRGGTTVVQTPETAVAPDMPQSVLDHVQVDFSLDLEQIGEQLDRLVRENRTTGKSGETTTDDEERTRYEIGIMHEGTGHIEDADEMGHLIAATCPDCGGPLWELEGEVLRFRCHTGHAFTAQHLAAGLKEKEEESLWVALRVMEERVRLLNRLADADERKGFRQAEHSFRSKAKEAEVHVQRLRNLLNGSDRSDRSA